MEENINKENKYDNLHIISKLFYLLLILYYLLNFTGTSALKFYFPVLMLFSSLSILMERSLINALCSVIAMIFVVGQGKILWSYHPFFHIAFDYLQILFIFKVIYQKKKIFEISSLPLGLLIPLALHLMWYFTQLFNIYNVGFVGTLAAGRVYVLPIIFFLAVLNISFDQEKEKLSNLARVCFFSFIAISSIALWQTFKGESFILGIAHYYAIVMGEAFIGNLYRPFSTADQPGGYAIYLATLAPLILIFPISSRFNFIFISLVIPLTMVSAIISQVRSAYIKYFAILFLSYLLILIAKRLSPLSLFKKFIAVGTTITFFSLLTFSLTENLDLESSFQRFSSLFDRQAVSQARHGPDVIFASIGQRLTENPLGLGPGRTGAAAGFSRDRIVNDPVYGLEYSWAHDNLFVSLATDLGWGMFIYIYLITMIIFYLFISTLRFYKNKDTVNFQIIAPCFIANLILVLGNWGAIGLVYNPESFAFWLFTGIALKVTFLASCPDKRQKNHDSIS